MNEIIPLSSIDHIFTGVGSYPIEFIFLYDGFLDENGLQESLTKTISHFQTIASILIRQSKDAYAFQLSPDGVEFDVVISKVNYENNDRKYEYINPVETQENNPLTKIKLTHTPKGTVLGVSISHSIVDGFSYFHFLSSWARIFQGKQFLPPTHQRDLLVSDNLSLKDPITGKEVLQKSGLFLDKKRETIAKEDLIWDSRIFKNEELKELLTKAQSECEIRLSYNDIVTAKLAQEYLEKWHQSGKNNTCYISCPVDFRRIKTGFPKTYFGNAVALTSTSISFEKLMQISLADLAVKIRMNVGKVNDEYIGNSIDTLTGLRIQDTSKIFENVHVMDPHTGLLVTNLSRLPVPDIEFNAGPPVKYDILTQSVRGAVILPHPEGLEARVCCPEDI